MIILINVTPNIIIIITLVIIIEITTMKNTMREQKQKKVQKPVNLTTTYAWDLRPMAMATRPWPKQRRSAR